MTFVKGINTLVATRIARRRRLDAASAEQGRLDRNDSRFDYAHFHKG